MRAGFLARSSEQAVSLTTGTRVRRLTLALVCAVSFVLTVAYHVVVWRGGGSPGWAAEAFYHLSVVACFGSLWLVMMHALRERIVTRARLFWTLLLVVLGGLALGRGLLRLTGEGSVSGDAQLSFGFDVVTGAPLTLVTVLKMSLLALGEAAVAFFLLLRLRELVLFKRTRSSQRNWYAMLVTMAIAALTTIGKTPGTAFGLATTITIIPAVVFMAVNALRVSWIVFLPFGDKMTIIGLVTLLLGLLSFGLATGTGGLLVGEYGYLLYYSYPLRLFTQMAIGFSTLYCLTAFLFLLFHLPTTSDFRRKTDEMAALQSLSNLIGQVFDREKLVSTIATSPIEAGAADKAWLLLFDPQLGALSTEVVSSHGITPAEVHRAMDVNALVDDVRQRRGPVDIPQAPADHRVRVRPGDGLESLVALPLLSRGEVLGVLFVARVVPQGFEQDDVDALGLFAAQAALALDNARLFEEQLEKERLAREIDIARAMQQRLLPQQLPCVRGLSLAATSVSAMEVGGDYYDFAPLEDGRLAVVVADVSGKGTSAAFYMAEMQGIFQSLTLSSPTPQRFLEQANGALSRTLERNAFVTALYGVLDPVAETFTFARAGHCPAAYMPLGGKPRLLRSPGLGLGLDRGKMFGTMLREETIALQPGDVLVLYTDGVVESRSAADEEYGYERLLASVKEHRHEDAEKLHDALMADLNRFLGDVNYADDLTLVVLKWHGLPLESAGTPGAPVASEDLQPAPVPHV